MIAKVGILVTLLAAALANKDCSTNRIYSCSDHLFIKASTVEDMCSKMRTSSVCLRSIYDDCANERDVEVENKLNSLEVFIIENCPQTAPVLAEKDCSTDRIYSCAAGIFTISSSVVEMCSKMRMSSVCLRTAFDDCVDDRNTEVENQLNSLEDLINKKCPKPEEMAWISKKEQCLDNYKQYIMECLSEGARETFIHFNGRERVNANKVKCTAFRMISECMVNRAIEKCSQDAVDVLKEEIAESIPPEITDTCSPTYLRHLF